MSLELIVSLANLLALAFAAGTLWTKVATLEREVLSLRERVHAISNFVMQLSGKVRDDQPS